MIEAKFNVGDLVSFDSPSAFGGAHYKTIHKHYGYPGIIVEVKPKYNSSEDRERNKPRSFAYRVAWANQTYTDEHECYLTDPKQG